MNQTVLDPPKTNEPTDTDVVMEPVRSKKTGTFPAYGVMIVKNEAPRYVQSVLEWHLGILDDIFVFDDDSEDETVDLCFTYTDKVFPRPYYVTPFMENESEFRQWAWDQLPELGVREDETVLMLDADEFYVGGVDGIARDREGMLACGGESSTYHMPEIWDCQWETLFQRIDGFWNKNWNRRLAKYRKGVTYSPKKMGGGSLPLWYNDFRVYQAPDPIMHFGYLDPADRQAKYRRYSSTTHGHSNAHIESIIQPPRLQKWQGIVPKWWRGVVDPSV